MQIMPLLKNYFSNKNYGSEVKELSTIINCSRMDREFKLRSRFDKKDKSLFFDVIIPYGEFMKLDSEESKKHCIASSLLRDIKVLDKYNPTGFSLTELETDFMYFFQNIGWIKSNM
jgi:hypothetical protein